MELCKLSCVWHRGFNSLRFSLLGGLGFRVVMAGISGFNKSTYENKLQAFAATLAAAGSDHGTDAKNGSSRSRPASMSKETETLTVKT